MTSNDKKALIAFGTTMVVGLTYVGHEYLCNRKLKKQSEKFRDLCEELIEDIKGMTARRKAQNDDFDRRIEETEFKSPVEPE